jgi:DNA-directed RNA polymerase specialized sigma24 family protein
MNHGFLNFFRTPKRTRANPRLFDPISRTRPEGPCAIAPLTLPRAFAPAAAMSRHETDAIPSREARRHSRSADVVRLRHFAGFSLAESAEVLGLPVRTVERQWTYARAWLFAAIKRDAR